MVSLSTLIHKHLGWWYTNNC